MNKYCIIFTSTDSLELAHNISNKLVQEKLAACVSTDRIQSSFLWEAKIIERLEHRLMIKAKDENYYKIRDKIISLHNDEVPEIIKLNISDGSETYLNWIGNIK